MYSPQFAPTSLERYLYKVRIVDVDDIRGSLPLLLIMAEVIGVVSGILTIVKGVRMALEVVSAFYKAPEEISSLQVCFLPYKKNIWAIPAKMISMSLNVLRY
jgi:hypothetical protein